MKKILLSLMCLISLAAKADEGMWTLYNLPQAIYEQMQQEGFELPYSSLYEGEGAIKNCVVNFGGYCSGVVVSPNGLVFTNHHCGFESIRSHSTVDHDYMLNGFVAKSYAEELPNENLFVSFMVNQVDITEALDSTGFYELNFYEQEALIDSLQSDLQRTLRETDSTLRLEIKPFYEGNKFYATTYRDFPDVRLVFAVPKSMGKFGGDTDNWMWPRQTCDFSVFRIYCDPVTGGPAEYSEKNVPYHPTSWAPVSLAGYQPGDFAMTVGYPGSTSRYLSSYGIQERRDAMNATYIQVRTIKQEIMRRHMDASAAVRIKYDSKYAQSANYWKNSIGMNKCIDSIGLIQQKRQYEGRIQQWQDSTGQLKGKLDFTLLKSLYQQRFSALRALYYWSETFGRTDELSRRARVVNMGIEVKGPKDKKNKQYIEFSDNTDTWDAATDCEILGALLKNYREQVPVDYHPAFFKTIDSQFGGDCDRYAQYLYKKSILLKTGKPIYVNRKSYTKDPGVQMGLDLIETLSVIRSQIGAASVAIDEQERYLTDAKMQMEMDMPLYSDANFTMRLSYGQIGGYVLNGKSSGFFTTAESLLDKMHLGNEISDYLVEPEMMDFLGNTSLEGYTDPKSQTMQCCFLSNNDITGGNSGSPVFNGKGQLIVLAFDGNWDSLSSDIFFDSQLARTISVDIRFVLFMIDRWGHADRLIQEIAAK